MVGRSMSTAHTTARNSLQVVASFCLALVSVCDQDPICRAVTSPCFCSSTDPTWDTHASMSSAYWTVSRRSASIEWLDSFVLSFSTVYFPVPVTEENGVRWFLRSLFRDATTLHWLRSNWRITLQIREKDLSFLWVEGHGICVRLQLLHPVISVVLVIYRDRGNYAFNEEQLVFQL